MNDYSWLSDAAERVLWTFIQVGLAAAVTVLADLDGEWVVPLTAVLAAIKAAVARHVGDTPDAAIGFTSKKPPV